MGRIFPSPRIGHLAQNIASHANAGPTPAFEALPVRFEPIPAATGAYFCLHPVKLPNGRLVCRADPVERLTGGAA